MSTTDLAEAKRLVRVMTDGVVDLMAENHNLKAQFDLLRTASRTRFLCDYDCDAVQTKDEAVQRPCNCGAERLRRVLELLDGRYPSPAPQGPSVPVQAEMDVPQKPSKPKLSLDAAAADLAYHLTVKNVKSFIAGNQRRQHIHVYVENEDDELLVPKEWHGFIVIPLQVNILRPDYVLSLG